MCSFHRLMPCFFVVLKTWPKKCTSFPNLFMLLVNIQTFENLFCRNFSRVQIDVNVPVKQSVPQAQFDGLINSCCKLHRGRKHKLAFLFGFYLQWRLYLLKLAMQFYIITYEDHCFHSRILRIFLAKCSKHIFVYLLTLSSTSTGCWLDTPFFRFSQFPLIFVFSNFATQLWFNFLM